MNSIAQMQPRKSPRRSLAPAFPAPISAASAIPTAPAANDPRPMPKAALDFLEQRRPATPCLVVDLDMIAARYDALAAALPQAEIFYAVKANPAPEILGQLARRGAAFDTASWGEIVAALAAGAKPDRISFGNTIKKPGDIAKAHAAGIRLFAFDAAEELAKIAAAAPGAEVYARILIEAEGALWPLNRKFGCDPEMAAELLAAAPALGLKPRGVSFHVGSQQLDPAQWDRALAAAARVFAATAQAGIELDLIDLGGGFPATYGSRVADIADYGRAIAASLDRHFPNAWPHLIVEPGRYMVADAGIIEAEILLVSRKSLADEKRWVYLDIGRYGGLAETEGEAIRYRIEAVGAKAHAIGPVTIAGPTCDSADILYDKAGYCLPLDLKSGDRLRLYAAGAYTTTYASVNFNGFAPLAAYYVTAKG